MSTNIRKNIGEAEMGGEPKKALHLILKDNSVGTEHIKDRSITEEKIAADIIQKLVNVVTDESLPILKEKLIANMYGNNLDRTVSQRLLTDTINDLYAKIREINGEPPVGLYMLATPNYFIGEEGTDIHIEAISTLGIFEKIAFFIDDVPLGDEVEGVYRYSQDTHVAGTTVIKCKATVLGIDYEVEKVVTRYNSFWLGAGATYEDIMDVDHIIPFENNLRGAYDITCNQGDHIIIIVGSALVEGFIRADLNGFEIPFTSQKVTKNGNDFWVMTSENVYVEGTYNIDING